MRFVLCHTFVDAMYLCKSLDQNVVCVVSEKAVSKYIFGFIISARDLAQLRWELFWDTQKNQVYSMGFLVVPQGALILVSRLHCSGSCPFPPQTTCFLKNWRINALIRPAGPRVLGVFWPVLGVKKRTEYASKMACEKIEFSENRGKMWGKIWKIVNWQKSRVHPDRTLGPQGVFLGCFLYVASVFVQRLFCSKNDSGKSLFLESRQLWDTVNAPCTTPENWWR